LVPTVDRAKATVTVKVRFSKLDERILPEMSAKVNFLSQAITVADQQPVLAVPPRALHEVDGRTVLWRVRAGQKAGQKDADAARSEVEPVPVKAGRTLGDVREVQALDAAASTSSASALRAGDKVVVESARALKAGDRIQAASGD
jgi:hypothetical protein